MGCWYSEGRRRQESLGDLAMTGRPSRDRTSLQTAAESSFEYQISAPDRPREKGCHARVPIDTSG